jgi:copper homeostasis protein
MKIKIELCTESVAEAIDKATIVDQIEFCSNLDQAGLSPALQDAQLLRSKVNVPIKIMIRQRSGDFVYSRDEMKAMIQEARSFMDLGFDRFVFGASHIDRRLNIFQINEFCKAVFPSQVCIHKAIDESPEIIEDLRAMLNIDNIFEVLTSGGNATAWEGREIINKMVEIANEKIDIIAAGSIRHYNLVQHQEAINASIFHGRQIVSNQ